MGSENDIYEMCRLCLAKEQVDVHIFEEESEEKQIFLKISTCLPIKISFDDRFPKKICTDCSCKLDAMYQFWNKSISSESQLLTWLDLNSIENVSTPDNRLNSINLHSHIYVKEEPIDCLKTEHDIKLEVMEESYDDESYNQPISEFPDQESSSHSKRKRDTSPECEINSDDDPLAQDTETKMYNFRTRNRRTELLEEVADVPSDCEEQSNTESEQDVSADSSDYQTDDIDEKDMQDANETERATTSRKRKASDTGNKSSSSKSRRRGRPSTKLYGKNKFAWETQSSQRRSERVSRGEVPYEASLADEAVNLNSLEDFWDLLFNEEIIDEIVHRTNDKIEEVCASLIVEDRAQTYHHHTDRTEIRAYIGVLYYAGLWKASKMDNNELWDKRNGINFYRGVFPRMRFEFLQSCLRFDVRRDRDPDDRLSPIRKIWSIFINNCTKYYTPSNKCTVDEQLLGYRGRCVFRMYIKSKPDKYGLKLFTLNDASTAYLIHAIPYLGKDATIDNPQILPSAEYFFQAVTAPIHGTNRSVTCDNWFTTIPLLTRMLNRPFNMALTGTIRKNKREIPMEMKLASKNPPETKFCHTKAITLLSHTPKKNKIVLVASTYLHTREITNGKPNIILHYNDTKGVTDTFDQLCHAYSVARRTNRWPMRIFFGMLDQAAVNSRIMWKLKVGGERQSTSAIVVLKKLIAHLTFPMLHERLAGQFLQKELQMVIKSILKIDNPEMGNLDRGTFDQSRRCALCDRKKDRKTRFGCSACRTPVCEEHRFSLCLTCVGQ